MKLWLRPRGLSELISSKQELRCIARRFHHTTAPSVWNDWPDSIDSYQLENVISPMVRDLPKVLSCEHAPNQESWQERVSAFLEERSLEKLVMARQTSMQLESAPDRDFLFASLPGGREVTHFMLELRPGIFFLGATPEVLFERKGRTLRSEALAGTRPLSADDSELLENAKERHEHELVRNFLDQKLRRIASDVAWGKTHVIETPRLKHLYASVTAELNEGVSDDDLLNLLHPTPALGGVPREKAMVALQSEPFDRGYFGAPIGYSSEEEAFFAVAIRSALVHGDTMHLFAGAGIIEGSDPQAEWEELNRKMGGFAL